jgi:hypothetical protein
MDDACQVRTPRGGAGQATAPLAFAGPVGLIAGENAGSYDEFLARATAALKPADIMKKIWVLRARRPRPASPRNSRLRCRPGCGRGAGEEGRVGETNRTQRDKTN